MDQVQFRAFTTEDWYGLAGATSFNDENPPRIAEIQVDAESAQVVVDAEGISIILNNEEGTEYHVGEKKDVILALLSLKPRMSVTELNLLGFESP